MQTKKMLFLLEKVCTDKSKVHKIAMEYCKDNLNTFHKVENYVFIGGGKNVKFSNMEEFDELRSKVKIIEESDRIRPETFELGGDIIKINEYLNKKLLIPSEHVEKNDKKVIDEIYAFMERANEYIFIASEQKIMLNDRFEFFRLHNMLENFSKKELSDDELKKIQNEIYKVKNYIRSGMAIKISMFYDNLVLLDEAGELIRKFDKSLYMPEEIPKTDVIKKRIQDESDVCVQANLFYKLMECDIPNFIRKIVKNCSKIEINKAARLGLENQRLVKLRDKEIFGIETEFLNAKSRSGLKLPFLKVKQDENYISNNERKQRIKDIKEKYARQYRAIEGSIDEIILNDKAKIEENMKYATEVQNFLAANIPFYNYSKA